jgi:type IV pilus assembly protein PilB
MASPEVVQRIIAVAAGCRLECAMAFLDRLQQMLGDSGVRRDAGDALPKCLGSRTVEFVKRTGAPYDEVRRLVDLLLLDAIDVEASDIHLDPFEDHVLVRFRVDGMLHDVVKLPALLKGPLANRVKVMADLKVYEHRVPQDGKARADDEIGGFEMRVSVSPMIGGEKISIRLFRQVEQRFRVAALGFDDDTLRDFLRLIDHPNGLFLMTGPVGSGKTTALYAALMHLGTTRGERLNITTVEDPVECTLPRVNQASVNTAQGFTYPLALRSILRHDPQVIMIGEIRDEETAGIAVRASLSGHLVLSTVHSATAAGAFARMTNLKAEPPLLASATLGVLNLRLARLNCQSCLVPYEPGPAALAKLGLFDRDDAFFRKGGGCAACGFTGFRGRAPVTELLVMNAGLEKLVAAGAHTGEIHGLAVQGGMRTLAGSAMQHAFAGRTTLEEVAPFL